MTKSLKKANAPRFMTNVFLVYKIEQWGIKFGWNACNIRPTYCIYIASIICKYGFPQNGKSWKNIIFFI